VYLTKFYPYEEEPAAWRIRGDGAEDKVSVERRTRSWHGERGDGGIDEEDGPAEEEEAGVAAVVGLA
jgi:hypothetical protein